MLGAGKVMVMGELKLSTAWICTGASSQVQGLSAKHGPLILVFARAQLISKAGQQVAPDPELFPATFALAI